MPADFGYDPDALATPSIDAFDSEAAANNLANVGSGYQDLVDQQQAGVPAVDAVSGGAAPDATPDNSLLPPTPDAAGAPETSAQAAAPSAAGSAPALPGAGDFPPPPPPPPLTGDPQQDVQQNVAYQRKLAEYHEAATRHFSDLNTRTAGIQQQKIARETAAQKTQLEARQAEAKRYEQVRAQRQTAIDEAIKDRMAARKSLESGNDDQRLHGGKLVAAIASAIGSSLQAYGAAQLGHPQQFENTALKTIGEIEKRKYEQKKQRLANASDALLEARYGHKEAQDNHRAALNDLDANMASELKLAALEADNQLARMGYDKTQRDANEVVIKLREAAAKHEGEIHSREEGHQAQRDQAAATLELARANLGERKSEFRSTMGERRQEFALRREDAADARAERERLAREKADEKKTKNDENLAIRDGSGIVRGYASSPRVVKPIQDRAIQYDDAIKSAEALLAYRREHGILGALPTGDAYDRAVLAVAATTQANASDATTAHEAGTLKKMGLVDEGAIEKTIEHLKDRQAAFMRQLRPLEPGEEKAGARVSLPPAEAAPTRTAAPKKAPKLNGADAEQMLKASKAGDHRFDSILKAHGLI